MIYSQTWGTGPQKALLLHCSLASSDAWRGMAAYLGDDLSMTGIDFPGHGRSPDWDGQGDYHVHCTDAAAAALVEPMHLIGHSLGATVALRLAVERPELVTSLTLIEPVFFAAAKGTAALQDHLDETVAFTQACLQNRHADAARIFTEGWGTGASWDDLPATMRQSFADRIRLVGATEGALYQDNAAVVAEGRIEAISCPVLLLEGDQSPEIIAAINGVLKARLARVKQARISGAGHMLPITHPGKVAAQIAAFLAPD